MAKKAVEKEVVVKETKVKAEPVVVATQELQLELNDRKVLNIHPHAKRVVVENLLGGDLYVSGESTQFNQEHVLPVGETKEFTGINYIYVGCFSRPVFKVTHLSE
ncbi:hypothetical protein [Peribacillus frigoritolerans]|uniref:Uncharacterized protein n=1 Tax=Peribacillus castrilensis TaxID=2897690 RepID=A0AAW9NP06_9BACI|nr:hypothetical protein [Peribacillus castrilensis]